MNECKASLGLLLILSGLVLVGCPTRAGVQLGEGEETAHERLAVEGARSFVVERPDQLLKGSRAGGRIGDVRIENGEIAVIIAAIDHKIGFGASGGNIIDAGRSAAGKDSLEQVLLYLDDTWPRQAKYNELKILEAGGPGKGSVIEVRGQDTLDPLIKITTRYELGATGSSLKLKTTLTNTGQLNEPSFELGDAVQWGNAVPFAPGQWGGIKGKRFDVEWVAGRSPEVSYGWVAGARPMGSVHGGGWSDLNVKTVHLQPGGEVDYSRHLVVGRASVASVLGDVYALRGAETFEVSGALKVAETEEVVSGAEVRVSRLEASGEFKPFVTAITGARGGFALKLPRGQFRVGARTLGRRQLRPDLPLEVDGGSRLSVTIPMSAPGRISFEIRDAGSGGLLPGKVTVLGRKAPSAGDRDPPSPDPSFGHAHETPGGNCLYTAHGSGGSRLTPGHYEVIASRGPEYTVDRRVIRVEEGAEAKVRFTIERVVQTRGWLAGDFHQHAERSSDSPTTMRDRVISNIAEGVEILGSSDHNVVTDYGPTIAQMKVGRYIATVIGDEVTTSKLGHFNAFPLRHDPTKPAGSALAPADLSPSEIFSRLRALEPSEKIIQVNHPRTRHSGYFNAMKLDKTTLEAEDPRMSWAFDAIEVFNGRHVADALELMQEWFEMLNKGGLFVAMGNSDTHLVVGSEPGYARTMVYLGHDEVSDFEAADLVSAIKARRAVVTNGPMVEATLDGTPVGGFVSPAAGRVGTLKVRVQAPGWISVDVVEVVSEGKVIHRWEGLRDKTSVVRLDASIPFGLGRPTWVLVRVMGDKPMSPVVPGEVTALAFTNPIWVGELVPLQE